MEQILVKLFDVWSGRKEANKSLRAGLRLMWTMVFGFCLFKAGQGNLLYGSTFVFLILSGYSFMKLIKWGAFDD